MTDVAVPEKAVPEKAVPEEGALDKAAPASSAARPPRSAKTQLRVGRLVKAHGL